MSTGQAPSAVEVFALARDGRASFRDLAMAIYGLEAMHCLAPPRDEQGGLEEWERVFEGSAKGLAQSMTGGQRPLGALDESGGYVPRVFSSSDSLVRFAKSSPLVSRSDSFTSFTRSWVSGLFDFLKDGCTGLVMDEGSAHSLSLNRADLAVLVAILSQDWFAELQELCLVVKDGKAFYQESKGRVDAFVFDSPVAADEGMAAIHAKAPSLATRTVPTSAVLHGLLKAHQVTRLVVNPGLPDSRYYTRGQLDEMRTYLADRARLAATSKGTVVPTPMLDQASWGEGPPKIRPTSTSPVPRPGRADEPSSRRLYELKELARGGKALPWELPEQMAYDLDLYVAIGERAEDGHHWPRFHVRTEATGKQVPLARFYTSETGVLMEMKDLAAADRRYHRLSGIEAARWAWSAPVEVRQFFVNPHDPVASVAFPRSWVLAMLFPTFQRIGDLELVPPLRPDHLGELRFAYGLKPEVLRALVGHGKNLLGPPRSGKYLPIPFPFESGSYLPIYSSREQYDSFAVTTRISAPAPVFAGWMSPWLPWLRATAKRDGLILDPGTAAPITLDHTDLLLLHLWSANKGQQPSGKQILQAAATLGFEDEHAEAKIAAIIAADWPRYFVGAIDGPQGGMLMVVPQTGSIAAFTTEEALEEYAGALREESSLQVEVRPAHFEPRLGHSVFHVAQGSGTGVWIDPVHRTNSGLRIEKTGIDVAVERLNARLRPRIPGF